MSNSFWQKVLRSIDTQGYTGTLLHPLWWEIFFKKTNFYGVYFTTVCPSGQHCTSHRVTSLLFSNTVKLVQIAKWFRGFPWSGRRLTRGSKTQQHTSGTHKRAHTHIHTQAHIKQLYWRSDASQRSKQVDGLNRTTEALPRTTQATVACCIGYS